MNDLESFGDDVIVEIEWYELEAVDEADEFAEWNELDELDEVDDLGEEEGIAQDAVADAALFADLVLPSLSELAALVADPDCLVDLDSSVLEPLPAVDPVG